MSHLCARNESHLQPLDVLQLKGVLRSVSQLKHRGVTIKIFVW